MILDTGQYLSVRQAAKRLGISTEYLYRLAKRYSWVPVKPYGFRLYRLADILQHRPLPPHRPARVGHPLAGHLPAIPAAGHDEDYSQYDTESA